MKPEEQRIAIAEACGWTNCCADNPMGSPSTGPIGCPSGRNIGEIWHEMRPLPDYLNSLDAMHEAEDKLQVHYSQAWSDTIVDIAIKQTSLDPEDLNGTERIGCFLSLGFPQPLLELLLRTLNLWKDDN